MLTLLSKDYGDIEAYADALLILREDLRDPTLRARGARWKATLARTLDECFAGMPQTPQGVGLLMATQWQGAHLWWSFEPRGRIDEYVEANLQRFVAAIVAKPSAPKKAALKSGSATGRRS